MQKWNLNSMKTFMLSEGEDWSDGRHINIMEGY